MIQTKSELDKIRHGWGRKGKTGKFKPYTERNDRCTNCNVILVSSASKERGLCGMCGRLMGEVRNTRYRWRKPDGLEERTSVP